MIKLSKFSRGTLIRIDDIAENMNWQLMKNVKFYLINTMLNQL